MENLVPLVHRTVNRYHCYIHHIHWNNYHSMDSSRYRYFRLGYTVKCTYYPSYMPRRTRLKFQCIYHGNIDLIRGIFSGLYLSRGKLLCRKPKPKAKSSQSSLSIGSDRISCGAPLALASSRETIVLVFSLSNDPNDHLRFLFHVKNDCNF